MVPVDQLDGVRVHRDNMAKGKALAALVLGQNPHEVVDLNETKPARHFGLLAIFSGEIYIFGGGVLIKTGG